MDATGPIIDARGVTRDYASGRTRTPALRGVDLRVAPGERVAIVGTSGSGKSTLLNIVGGLDRRYGGSVRVAGEDLARLGDRALSRLRGRAIGFVFQQFNLLEHLSCRENVALPAVFGRVPAGEARRRAAALLERVGLGGRGDTLAGALSGGQKQRVAIARALFNRPRLLLCDEPTGNLDSATGAQIIDLFVRINEEEGITLVLVTHEARVSGRAHRVVRLEDGRVVAGGGGAAVHGEGAHPRAGDPPPDGAATPGSPADAPAASGEGAP